MTSSGSMRDRYTFDRQAADENGDRIGAWGADSITLSAETVYLHGTETVQQARLQGDQPVIITVWACAASRAFDNTWRATDARDASRVFDVTSAEITPDRQWVQVLATTRKGQVHV